MISSCQGTLEKQNERERFKKLVHVSLEADKSQDTQSANWKPRRANGLVPIWGQRPETRRANGMSSNLKAGRLSPRKSWCLSFSHKAGEKLRSQFRDHQVGRILLFRRVSLFVLARPSPDWTRPTHIRKSNLLYSIYWFKCDFQLKKHCHKLRIMFSQISGHPVAQSSWKIKLTITMVKMQTQWQNQIFGYIIPCSIPRAYLNKSLAQNRVAKHTG